jgi:hypothetical protein
VRQSYPTKLRFAKPTPGQLQMHIEELCRLKVSELFQAVLEGEVDDALERLRYERRADSAKAGWLPRWPRSPARYFIQSRPDHHCPAARSRRPVRF